MYHVHAYLSHKARLVAIAAFGNRLGTVDYTSIVEWRHIQIMILNRDVSDAFQLPSSDNNQVTEHSTKLLPQTQKESQFVHELLGG